MPRPKKDPVATPKTRKPRTSKTAIAGEQSLEGLQREVTSAFKSAKSAVTDKKLKAQIDKAMQASKAVYSAAKAASKKVSDIKKLIDKK